MECEEPQPRRPILWFVLGGAAMLTALFTLQCLGGFLFALGSACFADTSKWEMSPFVLCIAMLVGASFWGAIWFACVALMRRISQ